MLVNLPLSAWIVIFFLTTFASVLYFYLFPIKNEQLERRLQTLNMLSVGNTEELKKQKPLLEKVLDFISSKIDDYINSKNKEGKFMALEKKFILANSNDTVSQHWAKKILYCMLLTALLSLIQNPLAIVFGAIVGFMLPDLSLSEKIKKRQYQLKKELPDFLDLLAATAPAAKTLENAIKVVCEKTNGEIPNEFNRVLDEINTGRRIRDALKDMAFRCGFKEMDTLVAQINQAESLGSPVQETLEMQSRKMRKLKQQLSEIKARKASVTLILPTVFLLYVCLVIIVGPSIIQVLNSGLF